MGGVRHLIGALVVLCLAAVARADGPMPREMLAPLVAPPMELGPEAGEDGVYELLNSGGALAGYVFETGPLAPLPGFSGAPVDVLVTVDLEGRFLDVRLLEHNEPIFVSGLPERLFREFFEQYRGHSIAESLVVGSPYGEGSAGSSLVYLDGVTKATASVRIAHESIMAATLQVAREKLGGVAAGPPAHPDPAVDEALGWNDLVAEGIAVHHVVTNAEIDAAFAGTVWAADDPEARADPGGVYLDLWVVDLGPPSVARAALSEEGRAALEAFARISGTEEPVLVVETGRHGLVSPDFVRNTAPDWISAEQGGYPVALRDADILIELSEAVPETLHDAVDEGRGLILRTDRRLGFDPSAPWVLKIAALREHGVFRPEIGRVELEVPVATPARFFTRPEMAVPDGPFLAAVKSRGADLAVLGAFLAGLFVLVGPGMRRFAGWRQFDLGRGAILVFVIGFVGWWGQGQLSIVTPLAVMRAAIDGRSLEFLLYDPFGLMIWGAAALGFVLWGRGLFCGWLCPFGAMQELTANAARRLRLPQWEPSAAWDARLKVAKYGVLAGLVAVALIRPALTEAAVEVEPFKTAITTFFVREWYFVAYAAFWLVLSAVTFKGFCRWVCPLGAVMAIGGLLRGRDWIPRRAECGTPCQLCRVKCRYGSIDRAGEVAYSECFQCLDCVAIHDDPARCVPLVLAARADRRAPRPAVAAR